MHEIVVDKSFLDGAPGTQVLDVFAKNKALIIESLFFELMTTDAISQIRCFSKVPEHPNSFALIPNVGTLLRYELENRRPCLPLHDRRIEGTYIFNAKLRNGTYIPDVNVLAQLEEWQTKIEADTRAFLERCQAIHQFFPELIGIEFRDFPAAVANARRSLATDHARVRSIYAQLRADAPPLDTLEPELLSPQWAWFRWVQSQMLAALRIFGRYQCRVPDVPTPRVLRNAEHSMLDVEYILAASLTGAIATNDTEVEEDFRLLCPKGLVVKPLRKTANVVCQDSCHVT